MKKIVSFLLVLVLMFSFAACNQGSKKKTLNVSADKALSLALEQAGATKDSITDLKSTLNEGGGISLYEISFKVDGVEYCYKVNALTGDIAEKTN